MTTFAHSNQSVRADISYFEPLEVHSYEKPYISNVPFTETPGVWNNLNQVKHPKIVVDIRGREEELSLDKNGFEYVKHNFNHPPTDHIDGFDHPYVSEVETFLHKRFEADMVFMYDAIVRKVGVDGYFQHADAAHIDHTPENCRWRLETALQKRGLNVQPKRIRIITAWKPLSDVVTHWPIAVCDASTVSPKECFEVDTVFPHYASELYHIGNSASHEWYYLSNQTKDEILLMQVYDSDAPSMMGCPHMSIDVGRSHGEKGRRDSVEARAVIVYL